MTPKPFLLHLSYRRSLPILLVHVSSLVTFDTCGLRRQVTVLRNVLGPPFTTCIQLRMITQCRYDSKTTGDVRDGYGPLLFPEKPQRPVRSKVKKGVTKKNARYLLSARREACNHPQEGYSQLPLHMAVKLNVNIHCAFIPPGSS